MSDVKFYQLLDRLWEGYTSIAFKIGAFNTKIILSVLYFTFFTLYSLISRLSGRDPLELKENKKESFWAGKQPSDTTKPF